MAQEAAGNTLATLLAWQNSGMVQNTGKGLISSWILSHPDYVLAVVDNADLGLTSFRGRDVNADSLIVAPALLGDTNLDGAVDSADLTAIRGGFGVFGGASWDDGDFDLDGAVDGNDVLTWQRAERHRLEPWAYVRDLLLRLHVDDPCLEDMLPDRWAAAHPEAILSHRLHESRTKAIRTRARRAYRRARAR